MFVPWNTGLTKETNASVARVSEKTKGRKNTQETKEKMKISHIGISVGRKMPAEAREKIRIARTGQKHTGETITKMMSHGSGHKKFPYVFLNGLVIKMRSSWEVAYAKYLDSLNILWKYESKGFRLSNGKYYFPDFYLPELNEWHEVKGWMSSEAVNKISLFRKGYPNEKLILIEKLKFDRHNSKLISFAKDGVMFQEF